MSLVLDGITAMERIKLSAEVSQNIAAMVAAGPLERVKLAGRISELLTLLGAYSEPQEASDIAAAFEKAKAFYQERLQGQVVQSVIGPVRISGKGWRKSKFGMKEDGLKARLVEHIVEILEQGQAGKRREPYNERSDGMVAFYFIKKDVLIDDSIITAGVTVGEDAQGNLFYNVSHSAAKGWVGDEDGALDSAWIEPRFTFDAVEAEASGETVADDDLNITILAVVPNSASGRAPAGGTTGLNGEFYKGGTFLPNTSLPKQGSGSGGTATSRGVLIEPGVFDQPPNTEARSILAVYGQFIHVTDGVAAVFERPDAAIASFVDEDVAEGRAFLRAATDAYNNGMRWYVPGEIEVADTHREKPSLELVEHVTKGGKGKTLRGVVRTDLTYAEAKAIDEYTFKKDGGWFIREKHLEGFVQSRPISERLAALAKRRDPDDPEAEMRRLEEMAQAMADQQANALLQEQARRKEVGAKLRAAGESVVQKAEEELGRDRNTNTARRASMAAGVNQRNESARATGLTMQNLAGAIESGEAKHLSGITSRAALESLQETLRSAMYESERGLSYVEQQARKGRAPTADDIKHASFPLPKWGTAGTSASAVLEAIKGKRGAPALAERVRFSAGPDADMIRDLKAMVGDKDTRYLIGWWNLEQVAKVARLKRAGINNTQELKDALVEYLQFREGARAEDPIAKAERAIIGQKVGIDFFPTPAGEAKTMARLAHVKEGDDVLEPSAGNGNLADAAKAAGANVDVIEISSQLRDILQAKGYNVVAHDFDSFTPEKQYDAVIMNPPFSSRRDADHIMRALGMVKPGGYLVAIAGEGVFIGTDAKAVAFREWLDQHGADVESLGPGTFKDSKLLATTGANARRIVIQR